MYKYEARLLESENMYLLMRYAVILLLFSIINSDVDIDVLMPVSIIFQCFNVSLVLLMDKYYLKHFGIL